MEEKLEVVIEEKFLLSVMGNYKSTSSSSIQQSQNRLKGHDTPHENTSSYTPRIISIGPLHHGNPELRQPMEKLKKEYLGNLLNRGGEGRNEELEGRFQKEASDMEQEARDCYELPNAISSDEFVDILVLDGCFLIEFLLMCRDQNVAAMDKLGWKLPLIKHDILLLENQIPFFVLEKLYDTFLQSNGGIGYTTMVEIASDYLYYTELWDQKRNFWAYYKTRMRTDQVRGASHLLHLYHKILFEEKHQPPISTIRNFRNWTTAKIFWLFQFVTLPIIFIHQLFADNIYPTRLTSAMELEEAGVKFQGSCMDLRFEEETLFVPVLTLNHQSFCLLKNLLAVEFYNKEVILPYVHTYVAFLSDLIRHPRDLKVMEKHHIITGSNGQDESIRLVNDLLEGGFQTTLEAFRLKDRFHWQHPREREVALMKYCQEPHHRWWARLMKDYFGNPWSILGLLVGVLLLVLTTLQTVFTMLSYYNP